MDDVAALALSAGARRTAAATPPSATSSARRQAPPREHRRARRGFPIAYAVSAVHDAARTRRFRQRRSADPLACGHMHRQAGEARFVGDRNPQRASPSRTSAFERPALRKGDATPASASEMNPGRRAGSSVALVPSTTTANPSRRAAFFISENTSRLHKRHRSGEFAQMSLRESTSTSITSRARRTLRRRRARPPARTQAETPYRPDTPSPRIPRFSR